MGKPDFSHYARITPERVARYVRDGRQPTDDMFAKALKEIEPPLMEPDAMRSLALEIDPKAERRGRRPMSHRSRQQLAEDLRELSRHDVPSKFVECLIHRLESGLRVTEAQRSLAFHSKFERNRSGMLAAGIYDEIRQLIEPGSNSVTHPILGTWAIKDVHAPLRDKALSVTNEVLRGAGRIGPISNDRLKNFISEYRTGKLHDFS